MINNSYGIVTFKSVSHAMIGEDTLTENGIAYKTIPTPREITMSCGLSIRFELENIDKLKKVLEDTKISFKGLYEYKNENGNITAEEIYRVEE